MLCGLSGGVDSATAAALVHRAVGDQLTCVLVDHGLMRKNEADQVVAAMEELGVNLIHVDAEQRFLDRLAGVDEPERKRKIIGEEFIRVFEDEAAKLEGVGFLVQGTLYSDVIESGGDGRAADTIKSHHNVGGLPEDLGFDLVEPLRMLFKDEVRAVAAELGLSERVVWRQPFPGPGLAIRIVGGEVNRERLDILRDADAILQEEIKAASLYRELWQSFCVLPVVRSVGVQGDGRTYAYPIVIRAVTSAGRDDRRLGAAALRPARAGLEPDHQRGRRRQPRRPRHQLEAARRRSSGSRNSSRHVLRSRREHMARGYAAGFFELPRPGDRGAILSAATRSRRRRRAGPPARAGSPASIWSAVTGCGLR